MKSRIKPATPLQVTCVGEAIQRLRTARNLLKHANCPRALERVRSALASAYGALRHVEHRRRRTNTDGASRHYSEVAR